MIFGDFLSFLRDGLEEFEDEELLDDVLDGLQFLVPPVLDDDVDEDVIDVSVDVDVEVLESLELVEEVYVEDAEDPDEDDGLVTLVIVYVEDPEEPDPEDVDGVVVDTYIDPEDVEEDLEDPEDELEVLELTHRLQLHVEVVEAVQPLKEDPLSGLLTCGELSELSHD